MTLVSVIIPTHNRGYVLGRAIESVLAQTHRELELLIVDDGSADNTEALVRGFGDPRIEYIRHAANRGQCEAINTGIRAAKGEYIACLDSDDEWLPTAIEKQLARFAQVDNTVGLVYTYTGSIASDGTLVPEFSSQLKGMVFRDALAQGYLAPSITLLVRRDCYAKVGGFDPQFSCFQDDDVCFRIAKVYAVDFVPEILALVHTDAEESSRLVKNRSYMASGWWALLLKHEADIRRECGEETLAAHFLKAGRMFMDAGDSKMASAAFVRARSTTSKGTFRLSVYDAVSRWRPGLWPQLRRLESFLARP